ncbi:MAG: hypothetical protein J7J21_05815, partial [Methanomicrobia archaeon]|nr:hypothetical protein [Methanomicrobia archaeon]
MKIPKNKALKLIDEKISQFQKVLANATYNNRYGEDYLLAYHGTKTLLTELFSKKEAMNFPSSVSSMVAPIGREIDDAKKLQDYK